MPGTTCQSIAQHVGLFPPAPPPLSHSGPAKQPVHVATPADPANRATSGCLLMQIPILLAVATPPATTQWQQWGAPPSSSMGSEAEDLSHDLDIMLLIFLYL